MIEAVIGSTGERIQRESKPEYNGHCALNEWQFLVSSEWQQPRAATAE